MSATSDKTLPPYIVSQGMRLLIDTASPRKWLRAEFFRAGRGGRGGAMGESQEEPWVAVDRHAVADNRLTLDDGQPCDLSRLVITTDAGIGKTKALQWLEKELNVPGRQQLAVLLNFHEVPASNDDWLRCLLPRLQRAAGNESSRLSADDACRGLEYLRGQGRLTLLLDALDQAPPDGSAVRALRRLLQNPDWKGCRIIVSGRPYALQRHWSELFDASIEPGWRFLQLDEFDEAQQRTFLGDARYHLIPAEAREILSTPRVLEYLRELPDVDLPQIGTAGDVYLHAVNHLLKLGMKGSVDAKWIGLGTGEVPGLTVAQRSLDRAFELLAAIAFRMTATRIPGVGKNDGADGLVPNFDEVTPGEFRRFRNGVYELLSRQPGEGDRSRMQRDMDALSALNEFLEHGIFDSDVSGLDRILWRNRTLQEFFTAYWLAQFCTADDTALLRDWITLPERPLSEEYYWVWRFLCEMHHDARNPECWSRAVEPLFRPGDGTIEGTRRSSELIYRAWPTLNGLANEGEAVALQARTAFWSEFEQQFLSGQRGETARQTAQQFIDQFIDIPAGEFKMGSPPEKQGMPEELRRQWKAYLEQEGDPAQRAQQHLASLSFAPGRAGQEFKAFEICWWTDVFRDKDVERIASRLYVSDETPVKRIQEIDGFALNRWSTINAWYRLFDPGHGLVDSWYLETYREISPDSETPAIYISWYDAWAFCLWARWDGDSCRLPHENEWEYAAKGGTEWHWNYWWDDNRFDSSKCNADRNVGRTTRPDPAHSNPFGLVDILGNVWEWTADEYRAAYDLDAPPDSSARVLRGGSWGSDTFVVRSAYRDRDQPWNSEDLTGFRVARALPRKS